MLDYFHSRYVSIMPMCWYKQCNITHFPENIYTVIQGREMPEERLIGRGNKTTELQKYIPGYSILQVKLLGGKENAKTEPTHYVTH